MEAPHFFFIFFMMNLMTDFMKMGKKRKEKGCLRKSKYKKKKQTQITFTQIKNEMKNQRGHSGILSLIEEFPGELRWG